MVKCEICKKEFRRLQEGHLKKHDITYKQYRQEYPNAKVISDESRLAYSTATKVFFESNPGVAQKRADKRVISSEVTQRRSESMKKRWVEDPAQFITEDRSKAISTAKKEWWAGKSKQERSTFIKQKVVTKTRERLGEEAYRAQLRERGIKGYNALMYRGSEKLLNKFEQEMVNTIINKGYNCITQFEINKWFYDSYIPEKNLIIEFDGDYWHPKTIEDCDNKRLKKQWNIDRKKEAIAMQEGYNIVRIRESEKHLLLELI